MSMELMSLSIRQTPILVPKGAANDLVAHDDPLELHNPLGSTPLVAMGNTFYCASEIAVRRGFWPPHRLYSPTGVTST